MASVRKLLDQVLRGDADANISFSAMTHLLRRLGFEERVKGSHHIFFRTGVAEISIFSRYKANASPTR
jgi:hypothetical protein